MLPFVIKSGIIVLYILSSGIFFPGIGKKYRIYFLLCGIVAIGSTSYFFKDTLVDIFGSRTSRQTDTSQKLIEVGVLVRDIISLNEYNNKIRWRDLVVNTPTLTWSEGFYEIKGSVITHLGKFGQGVMRMVGNPDIDPITLKPARWDISAISRAGHQGADMISFSRRGYLSIKEYRKFEDKIKNSLNIAGIRLNKLQYCGGNREIYDATFLDKRAVFILPRDGGTRGMTVNFSVIFRTSKMLFERRADEFEKESGIQPFEKLILQTALLFCPT